MNEVSRDSQSQGQAFVGRGRRSLTTWTQLSPQYPALRLPAASPHPNNSTTVPCHHLGHPEPLHGNFSLANNSWIATSRRHLSGLLTWLGWGCDTVDPPVLGTVFCGQDHAALPSRHHGCSSSAPFLAYFPRGSPSLLPLPRCPRQFRQLANSVPQTAWLITREIYLLRFQKLEVQRDQGVPVRTLFQVANDQLAGSSHGRKRTWELSRVSLISQSRRLQLVTQSPPKGLTS